MDLGLVTTAVDRRPAANDAELRDNERPLAGRGVLPPRTTTLPGDRLRKSVFYIHIELKI